MSKEQAPGIVDHESSGTKKGKAGGPAGTLPRHMSQSTKPDGSGLGLFISQSILQQHGGTIEVQTEEGEGATFTVWLPVS